MGYMSLGIIDAVARRDVWRAITVKGMCEKVEGLADSFVCYPERYCENNPQCSA